MLKLNLEKFNIFTIISVLMLIAGIAFYIYWIARYGILYDISVYSVTIIFVIAGILGIILSLMETEEKIKQ